MSEQETGWGDAPFGLLAEFGSEEELVAAARRVRDAGYTRTDAYTPYPSHDVIEALVHEHRAGR